MKYSKVHLSKDTKSDNEEISMDPDLAAKFYEDGGFLIIKYFPEGAEFGIYMHPWNTGSKFLGVQMIPAGLHFIYYSPVNKEGSLAPRRGFFYIFTPGQIVVQKFDKQTEDLVEDVSEENNARVRSNLKNIDGIIDIVEEVLEELQFSFLCFLVCPNFDSFNSVQWK